MANSTASIFIKPTVAFNRGDTFVFGSWICTADGTRSFQRRLTMTPNPRIGLVTLPEVITGDLARKFGEISLYNQHADFESGSASNSNPTSPWVTTCESTTEPSCVDAPLHEHFPFGLCNASRAHAEALTARRAGRFVYWSDRKPTDLTDVNSCYVAYLNSLPFQEGTPLAPTEEHTPTEVASTDSSLGTLDRQVFMAVGEMPGPSGTRPDRYFEDISADELSANAPADETNDDKNARCERNRKRNK
jgi:hypothetical protein